MSNDNCCQPGVEINTCEGEELFGCGCLKTQPFGILAGTYAKGDVLYKTATVGVLTNKATTPGAVDTDAFAIMPFGVVLAADDEMAVYTGGEFNEAKVVGYDSLGVIKTVLSERGVSLRAFS